MYVMELDELLAGAAIMFAWFTSTYSQSEPEAERDNSV